LATVESAGERHHLVTVEGGPERFFRVARPEAAGEVVSSSMPAGPWLNGPYGRPLAGALGVLVDNVAGYVLVRRRPPGWWSVSAEITLDLLRPVPADGSVVAAEGIVRHVGQAGGFSSASVTDSSGRLLAVATQHGRWVQGAPAAPATGGVPAGNGTAPAGNGTAPAGNAPPGRDLAGFLGGQVRTTDGGALLELTVTPELTNPLGNMHGGIILCACDLVAQAAIDAAAGPPRTASIHVAYPRPIPAGAKVRLTAQVAHLGRTFGIVRVTALNHSGRPAAIATVTTGPSASPGGSEAL
jgi:uncharacterized protein (TIGR00369 family)